VSGLDLNSLVELQRVHPLLSATFTLAHARYDALMGEEALAIRVTEGYRTHARQQQLFAQGKSRATYSAHQEGMAIDIAFLTRDRAKALWELNLYREFNGLMQAALKTYLHQYPDLRLIWGGDWKSLVDGVHWELQGADDTAFF